ncbi:DUF6233 domain-containing protein [Streptomyces collinus]|uniref:DUF6233 domain-containing protein n=1 Tax=Streptomyces collinus TaxID=42684 RepID=UPI00362F2E75
MIQHGLDRQNIGAVHTGGCRAAAKSGRCRPATREQALDALRRQVPACVHCRPDAALGVPDQDVRARPVPGVRCLGPQGSCGALARRSPSKLLTEGSDPRIAHRRAHAQGCSRGRRPGEIPVGPVHPFVNPIPVVGECDRAAARRAPCQVRGGRPVGGIDYLSIGYECCIRTTGRYRARRERRRTCTGRTPHPPWPPPGRTRCRSSVRRSCVAGEPVRDRRPRLDLDLALRTPGSAPVVRRQERRGGEARCGHRACRFSGCRSSG